MVHRVKEIDVYYEIYGSGIPVGHNLQIEQDLLFASLVREWLDRVSGSLDK